MKFPIPDAALTQHVLILGKTRSGKSSKARLIAERFLDQRKPVCIVDPKGDWWGLKSSADGKAAGYPIIIFGTEYARHADYRITSAHGAVIAEIVATGNRPAIVDLKGMRPGERARFFCDFAETYFRLASGERVLILDEVHNFAPQGRVMDPQSGEMLHWANRLVTEGGGMGITMVSASQRPQKVHKDFATSHETLIACRVIHKLDRDADKDWVDACGDPAVSKDMLGSLASMPRTDAWVYSPEAEFGPVRVTFPMFKTFDSFAPQAERNSTKLKGWAEVDLNELQAKMATVVEAQKARDPKELQKRVADLTKERDALAHRLERAGSDAVNAPVAEISPEERQALINQGFSAGVASATKIYHERIASISMALANVMVELKNSGVEPDLTAPVATAQPRRVHFTPNSQPLKPVARAGNGAGDPTLPKGERAVLICLAQRANGCTRKQLTALTGFARSTRDSYLQRLAAKSMVDLSGQRITITDIGRAALGEYEPLPTGNALHQMWLRQLPDGESKILGILIQRYPNGVSRDDLRDPLGFARSTSDSYIQRLAAKELVIPTRNGVTASADLFE